MNRRQFIKLSGAATILLPSSCLSQRNPAKSAKNRPNIILCMCDDLGWGDVGYHKTDSPVKTPYLDAMAANSLQFSRFYAGAPVCSPTRGNVMTGRHPFRFGIYFACDGRLKPEELTLAEAVKTKDYTTGHFGKWHLGTIARQEGWEGRWGKWKEDHAAHYSPPWENGFDVCFSTEMKVPTWNPMRKPGKSDFYGGHYWTGEGEYVDPDSPELTGDDSRVIMDKAIPFIKKAASGKQPFLAVIWFHTPHKPIVAGPKYKAMYSDLSEKEQEYYGCITAMDEQMGRLRKELRDLGIADNTMLWFTSDNGPENKTPGITGGFRARKRSLYEGGVRVPGLLEWPARIKQHRTTDVPCCTSDYFPTSLDILGAAPKGAVTPVDGISLLPLIEGKMSQRPAPIAFQSKNQRSLSDNRYKLYSSNKGKSYQLYDLIDDPYEKTDIAEEKPDIVASMKKTLETWVESCSQSNSGKDYE